MEKSLAVAKALYRMYECKFDTKMDEMKMHKLMYFTQREAFIQKNCQLFDENFYGWRYGPVLHSVRHEYMKEMPFEDVSEDVSEGTQELLDSVLERYGKISSWNLSMLSHEEVSWRLARTGLDASENGERALSINAIQLDAAREAVSRSIGDKESK